MVGLEATVRTQSGVIRACSTLIMSEMSRTTLSVTADYTVTSFPSFLRIVSYWLEVLEIIGCPWTRSGIRGGTTAYRLGQTFNQPSPKSQVSDWSLSSSSSQLLVNYVGVDDHHLQQPEDLAPPLHRLVEEAVVSHELIQFVYPQHELVVVGNNRGLVCDFSTPGQKKRGKYT